MITLKDYQNRVLDSIRDFFRQCSKDGRPEAAFQAVQIRNGVSPTPYFPITTATGLATGMPYVCLRVPTGGGKTLLACYAAGLAMDELLHTERAVVLWLVPSNTILDQTLNALRDKNHPYRRAVEMACGSVDVISIEEALHLSRAAVEGQTVIILATIQAFRVEDPTGRKVYEQNGAFLEHLLNVPSDRIIDLLPRADGKPVPSLVNMLRLRRPIVIVDEAHNARTDLSFATLGNLLPSCIIEFTATPARVKQPSNVLHRVSAAELKAADMIKLPLRIVTRHPSQRDQLLAEAVKLRSDLEKVAISEGQQTGEYLRPIMLLQAERVDACEPLRNTMAGEFNIPKEQIKISTGSLDELKGLTDINQPKCPVRFIITVEKLREGWDCPFAYVLCSLKETHSATAIEQIVGRILRLPQAKAKYFPDLNCSYAFSVSGSLPEVLNEFREALESNGFTSAEAERILIPVPYSTLPLGMQPKTAQFDPNKEIDSVIAQVQVNELAGKVKIDLLKGEVTVFVPLADEETEKLVSCVKTPEAKARIKDLVNLVRDTERAFGGSGQTRVPSPYEQHLDFTVPRLMVVENGRPFEFESTFLLEHFWQLSAKDSSLSPDYNPVARPAPKAGMLDVSKQGDVETSTVNSDFVSDLHRQVLQLGNIGEWTQDGLIKWLDKEIRHEDIPFSESTEYLRKSIRGLMTNQGIADVNILALDRFRLRDEIEKRIQQHREVERKTAFQKFLLPGSALAVSNVYAIDFKTIVYEPSWSFEGGFQFKKHYFGAKPGELHERTPVGELTEEFKCAQFIDSLPEVKYWIRNLARRTTSFRLQTSTDWFYPDFLCQLTDGRVLVIEYKGQYLYDAVDAEEKRAIGAVWSSRSSGRCLFIMPPGKDFQAIFEKIKQS